MTDIASTDAASAGLSMNEQQFTQLITTVAAALRQTSAPLSADQQAVAFQFRLLRNGLGRFESASEKLDRALIRVDQIQYEGGSLLEFHDPIPPGARSMVLTVDSRRATDQLPASRDDGSYWHPVDSDQVTRVVELVEFLDQFDIPVAAGVPVQVQRGTWNPDSLLTASEPASASPRYSRIRPPKAES